jgi:hypothetical protein
MIAIGAAAAGLSRRADRLPVTRFPTAPARVRTNERTDSDSSPAARPPGRPALMRVMLHETIRPRSRPPAHRRPPPTPIPPSRQPTHILDPVPHPEPRPSKRDPAPVFQPSTRHPPPAKPPQNLLKRRSPHPSDPDLVQALHDANSACTTSTTTRDRQPAPTLPQAMGRRRADSRRRRPADADAAAGRCHAAASYGQELRRPAWGASTINTQLPLPAAVDLVSRPVHL